MNLIKALGLDIGKKRIGVAGCDRLGICAFRITTIHRKSWLADMKALQSIIQDREIDTLVVGMPYNMDGTLGQQAEKVEKYARKVAEFLQMNLEFVDERLTSFSAETMLKEMGYNLRENKDLIDQQSAVIILQQWLDSQRPKQSAYYPVIPSESSKN